jgi:hypothetical protein
MGRDAVILSPHFDDAVLSCWHVLASAGEVLVVNVFAGEPVAGALGWWDRLAGASDSATAVRTRIEEDRQALALALAGRTAVNLPFLDSQYRHGDQAPEEIVEALRGVLLAGARIYAPASLGDHHRDHTAVRAAALALQAEGADVVLYADLPHATVDGWPRRVLNGGSSTDADPAGKRWESQLETTGLPVQRMVAAAHRLPTEDRAGKLEAMLTYGSQIAPLQRVFRRSLEDPRLLGFEVEWRLPLIAQLRSWAVDLCECALAEPRADLLVPDRCSHRVDQLASTPVVFFGVRETASRGGHARKPGLDLPALADEPVIAVSLQSSA